ncbi:MAG: hypothetical protein HY869_20735 [Chloroflexi bacterium]|nr:hypothetical protein [Chloroflexota bacterium]
MKSLLKVISLLVLASLLLAACATATPTPAATEAPTEAPTKVPTATEPPVPAWTAPEGALVAVMADAAPTLDGVGDEAAWSNAEEIVIEVSGGANGYATEVHLKAIYTADSVYFLMSYADTTESFFRSPWQKQEDGTWKKINDPSDKGGDNNLVYEDKMAFIWPINEVKNFEAAGCFVACHAGENSDIKPYGNKYLPEGEMADIWHWKSVRNLNQVDDQYLDSTTLDTSTPENQTKTIEAGRHSDPKDSGGYSDNYASKPDPNDATKTVPDKSMPGFSSPNFDMTTGAPGYILDADKIPFDDAAFKAGDYLPGIVKSEIVGDRGNISAGWKYVDGTWTLEFGRKLDTGSQYDVQFTDLSAMYYFAMAVFDNAQVRHAFQAGASFLIFKP